MGRIVHVSGGVTQERGPSLERNAVVSILLALALLSILKTSLALTTLTLDLHWFICLTMIVATLYAGSQGKPLPAAIFSSLGAIYANDSLAVAGLERPRIELLMPSLLAFTAAIEPAPLPRAGRMLRTLGAAGLLVGLLGILYGPSLGFTAAPWGSETYWLAWAILLPLAIVSLGTIITRSWGTLTKAEGMIAVGLGPWLGYALLTLLWPSLLHGWAGEDVTVGVFKAWLLSAPVGYVVASLRERNK